MKTKIIGIDPRQVDEGWIRIIAKALNSGGVMVYPTETFYGLGAVCFSNKALRKIYALKRREVGKPLSLIVSDFEMLKTIIAPPPPSFFSLTDEFWPGPLTLILRAAPSFPAEMAGPGHTIAVRIPPSAWLRELVGRVGLPITATSANISGQGELAEASDVIRTFKGKVDIIVDGGRTPGTRPSTIVDLSGEKPHIVREGAISVADLEISGRIRF